MIKSFGDRRTQALFEDRFVRDFQGVARVAKRKLELVNAAARLEELRMPPGNRLELLRGTFEGLYSIRVNDQWRVVFRWADGDAYDVRIMDYH
jgi:proteic killer suppression protein